MDRAIISPQKPVSQVMKKDDISVMRQMERFTPER
jgi:hypothetical protein